MMEISKGKYWDSPWSLVDGCAPCSPGCDHCWSAAMAHRFQEGLTFWPTKAHPHSRFCGKIITHPDRLSIPIQRKKPTVFSVWNDFWHEYVPDNCQYKALEIMGSHECAQHIFLVLTKRPQVAAKFFAETDAKHLCLDNVYFGLTVVNQAEADEKIPVFLQVPGKKFLNIEPCLGTISLGYTFAPAYISAGGKPAIDAVILGGETGPGARPMHPDWVRSVRDQCAAAGVPFFFKGWGEWSPETPLKYCKLSRKRWSHESVSWARDGSEYNPLNPPLDHFPSVTVYRVGRKAAGRLLDGKEYNELPWRIKLNRAGAKA